MERTWQGSGLLLLLSTDSLKLKLPLGWLPTCKIKRHHRRSLHLTGLQAELLPRSPADSNPSPISDVASHRYPTQRATKREWFVNQRSPLQLTLAELLFIYTSGDTKTHSPALMPVETYVSSTHTHIHVHRHISAAYKQIGPNLS